ncbi:hypothetical protein HU200_045751 [Digitaria exilis]|uniref:Uncharacterized protein n=1 Tax=Digitaria exilis TaxID=1010633 RepID=A0A835AZG4_9POAL|nr:hypothetical protein HU200_045751 [Digitaria exilis]
MSHSRHRRACTITFPPPARAMATVHPPPPPFALLPRRHADDVETMEDGGSDTESVAESCPCPCPRRRGAATDDDSLPSSSSSSCGGGGACCHSDEDGEGMDEDDGCSSCVEGDEWNSYQEAAADEDRRNEAGTGAWWEKLPPVPRGATALPLASPARAPEAEDPKRAAAQQEEDRKFWEDCLASGSLEIAASHFVTIATRRVDDGKAGIALLSAFVGASHLLSREGPPATCDEVLDGCLDVLVIQQRLQRHMDT